MHTFYIRTFYFRAADQSIRGGKWSCYSFLCVINYRVLMEGQHPLAFSSQLSHLQEQNSYSFCSQKVIRTRHFFTEDKISLCAATKNIPHCAFWALDQNEKMPVASFNVLECTYYKKRRGHSEAGMCLEQTLKFTTFTFYMRQLGQHKIIYEFYIESKSSWLLLLLK